LKNARGADLCDREDREVVSLVMIDGRPALMAEVKAGDDTLANAFWDFGCYFPRTPNLQIVPELKRSKEKKGVAMVSAHVFLSKLTLSQIIKKMGFAS
jgi:hypothetical protein